MIIGVSILALMIELLFETNRGDRHGVKSSIILGATIITMFLISLGFYDTLLGGVTYLGLRFGIFDYAFSYIKYNHIWYLGTSTVWWDQWMKKINSNILLVFRIISIIFAIAIELYLIGKL